jgi:hypothetical protein
MTNIDYLNRKNIQLNSKLLQKQLKHGNYSFEYSKKEMLEVLGAYKTHKSIFKAASSVNVDPNIAIMWYREGMRGNSLFRGFYLAVNKINDDEVFEGSIVDDDADVQINDFDGDYKISQYGDGWSYTTYVNGEKIFIISNELETLKRKVKDKHLPLE